MSKQDGKTIDLNQVIAEVGRSRRYKGVDLATIERVALEVTPRSSNRADAVKRTKRRLHQAFGAYVPTPPNYTRLLANLRAASRAGPEAMREALREAMQHHASSRERIGHLETFYDELAKRIGTPRSVLDIGCGLNPLAAPWMRLAPDTDYWATDIDHQLLRFIDDALSLLGIKHRCEVFDALDPTEPPPAPVAEVALCLKVLPCLERQQPDIGTRLLDRLGAPTVVLSFPTRSLGGRHKSMPSNYRAQFEALAAGQSWQHEHFEVPGELIYVIRR